MKGAGRMQEDYMRLCQMTNNSVIEGGSTVGKMQKGSKEQERMQMGEGTSAGANQMNKRGSNAGCNKDTGS